LAAEYAGFLSPELRLEVLDVWLRFRSGDATLADEILERADDDANLWAATRAQGRVKRREFTDTLKAHGCTKGFDYAHCTNKVYGSLFDRTASQLKLERAVKTTRDGLNIVELSAVMLSEGLASERIQEEQCVGRQECGEAAGISASNVRKAIEADRSSRQRKRLV
jgi:hypothetical protein